MAPTLVAAISPFLNSIRVGMPRTPYLVGVSGLSSMLTLATRIWPFFSVARSSRKGAIVLQGPHHSAQKSTTTGTSDLRTSASNAESVVWMIVIVRPRTGAETAVGSRLDRSTVESARNQRQAQLGGDVQLCQGRP